MECQITSNVIEELTKNKITQEILYDDTLTNLIYIKMTLVFSSPIEKDLNERKRLALKIYNTKLKI